MNLALFARIWGLFFGPTSEKHKENQCFWYRTLKKLRKIKKTLPLKIRMIMKKLEMK